MNSLSSTNLSNVSQETEHKLVLIKTLLTGEYSQYIGFEVELLSATQHLHNFCHEKGDEIDKEADKRSMSFNTLLIEKLGSVWIGDSHQISVQDLLHFDELLNSAMRKQVNSLKKSVVEWVTRVLRKTRSKIPVLQIDSELAEMKSDLESTLEQLNLDNQSEERSVEIVNMNYSSVEELRILLKGWYQHLSGSGVPKDDPIAAPVFRFFELIQEQQDLVLKIMIGWKFEIIVE